MGGHILHVFLLLLSLCKQAQSQDGCADVVDASAQQSTADSTWSFTVTVSSDETGWDKYADAWEIRRPDDGTVLGTRVLAHPHVNEQPFTRSLARVVVPEDVEEVLIAARDSVLGFCGEEFTLQLPRLGSEPTLAPIPLPPPTRSSESSMPSFDQTSEASISTETTSSTSSRVRSLRCSLLFASLVLLYT